MARSNKAPVVTEMRRSWLVQRLTKPRQSHVAGLVDNPFSFGGGMVNGGLSKDAMSLLRPIFGFDYMGAAEFEFGAVPEALSSLASHAHRGNLDATQIEIPLSQVKTQIEIPLSQVKPNWREKKDATHSGEATVYLLGRKDHLDQIEMRVREMAQRGYEYPLKESTRLDEVLRPDPDPERASWNETRGWLELDNGFMFFTDHDMWQQTCSLFGVEVSA